MYDMAHSVCIYVRIGNDDDDRRLIYQTHGSALWHDSFGGGFIHGHVGACQESRALVCLRRPFSVSQHIGVGFLEVKVANDKADQRSA